MEAKANRKRKQKNAKSRLLQTTSRTYVFVVFTSHPSANFNLRNVNARTNVNLIKNGAHGARVTHEGEKKHCCHLDVPETKMGHGRKQARP